MTQRRRIGAYGRGFVADHCIGGGLVLTQNLTMKLKYFII